MKGNKIIIVYAIAFVLFILIDWVRFDLIIAVDNIGFNLFFGAVLIGFIFLYMGFLIFSVLHLILRFKVRKLKAVIPVTLMLIVFSYYILINYSQLYMDIDFFANKNNREKIIEMYEDNQLKQIGVNSYLVPFRAASHNKKVYFQNKDGVLKAIFFVSNGFTNDRILLYVSDDGMAYANDFGNETNHLNLQNIRKVSSNWYYADLVD